MPIEQRRTSFDHRVAFIRCCGLRDKAEPIVELLRRSTPDVTGAQVIASFLAWAEARRLPNLRFMNASVADLLVKGDHSKTTGHALNATWVYNLVNEDSVSLGHFLTKTTATSEIASWLKQIGKRPGMKPIGVVLDDWLIGRSKYIEQLGRVEAGLEADFSGTVWDEWKAAFPTLRWPFLDKFHITQHFKLKIPFLNFSLPNRIFCVGARQAIGGYDADVQSALEGKMMAGEITVKEFSVCGIKRSCVEGRGKSRVEIEAWHADGSFGRHLEWGPTKCLG
jgi:hypothetical protein